MLTAARVDAGFGTLYAQNPPAAYTAAASPRLGELLPRDSVAIDYPAVVAPKAQTAQDVTPWRDPALFGQEVSQGFTWANPTSAAQGWNFGGPINAPQTTAAIVNAPPLLIPLPSAAASGAYGLLALALIATARRVRRRILAGIH